LDRPTTSRSRGGQAFKGAVTSDGLPEREMAACIMAGSHRGLIPVLGRLQGIRKRCRAW
jgi:hypothetical protein